MHVIPIELPMLTSLHCCSLVLSFVCIAFMLWLRASTLQTRLSRKRHLLLSSMVASSTFS